jgi:hypothetical protein
VARPQPEETETLAAHPSSDHVPDVRDDAADEHQRDDQENPWKSGHEEALPGC